MKRHVFLMTAAAVAIVLAGCKPKADEHFSAPGYITLTVAPNLEGAYSIELGLIAQLLIIDWGDGSAAETYPKKTIYYDVNVPHPIRHVYAGDGTYTVQIKGEELTGFIGNYSNTTSLDVSGCPALAYLHCGVNNLTVLDVSKCPALLSLDCLSNQLTSLDVSQCPALRWLGCGENQLTSLDVSQCPALQSLDCDNNQLTSLDVSGCPVLQHLHCDNNQLTSLDVSQCPALRWLDCDNNRLTSLDVGGCATLQELRCYRNELTSLDVGGCPALLWYLDCYCNQLTSLDVSKCPALEYLDCDGNQLSAAALNTIFTALPNRTAADDTHIHISGNPGAERCNRAIAGSKGWSFWEYYH